MSNPYIEDPRHYLETHGLNILQAMQIAKAHAVVHMPDVDDRSYWDHEIQVLHETMKNAGLPRIVEPTSCPPRE